MPSTGAPSLPLAARAQAVTLASAHSPSWWSTEARHSTSDLILQTFQQQKAELNLLPSPPGTGGDPGEWGPGGGAGGTGLVEVVAQPGQEREFRLQLSYVMEAEEGEDSVQGIVVPVST